MAKRLNKTEKLRQTVMRQFYRMRKKGFSLDDALKSDIKSANYSRLKSYQKNRYTSFKEYEQEQVDAQSIADDYPYYPDEGQVLYEHVLDLIDQYPTQGAQYIKNLLDYEINQYGLENLLRSLSQAGDDVISAIQETIYYEKSKQDAARAIKELANTLKGNMPTEQEAQDLGDVLDKIAEP